jgi:hypothetical protein
VAESHRPGRRTHSDVAVSSWGTNRLDLFRKGDDNTLEHRFWDGKVWTDWVTIGTGISDTPAAASWGRNRIDVLALGTMVNCCTNTSFSKEPLDLSAELSESS